MRIKGQQGRSDAGKGLPEDVQVKQGAPAFPANDFGVVGVSPTHF